MDSIQVNGVTYWLPENSADVMQLVNDAIAANEIICMRGSAHSFPLIGNLEKNATGRKYKYVMLSKLRKVTINAELKTVTVEGGCNLGLDPWDPTGISTLENSLLYQLDQQGLAIPDLGGITHQTVGGFLSTASSGGSTTFSFEDALIGIDLITTENGQATLSSFSKPATFNPDDPFYGVGVASLGVMGIIVSATFQCVPKFFVAGQEATTLVTDCEVDLFGPGTADKPSLQQFMQQVHYTRLMWWPQKGVEKMVVWKAWQSDEAGAKMWAWNISPQSTIHLEYSKVSLKPYREVPYVGGTDPNMDNPGTPGTPLLSTMAAGLLFSLMGTWPNWLLNSLGDTDEYRSLKGQIESAFYPLILPEILSLFVVLNSETNPPQRFADFWYEGIPMDNQMSDRLFPVWFTELWIPIEQSEAVMNALKTFYDQGPEHTGPFSCEIYAAKSNNFWLSPSYQTDVIRIDVFWFAHSNADPTAFFQQFWNLLQPYSYRPHWGKFLPAGDGPLGVSYLQSRYPKWSQWMQLREKLDPCQVFLNDYWRSHLAIPEKK